MATATHYEAAVIGGGPAGLQAALTMSRVGLDVVLIDAGEGRNASTHSMHNVITRDGISPAEFRIVARRELESNGVTLIDDRVETVRRDPAFALALASGRTLVADRVVLATGVVDDLSALPEGLAKHWGNAVFHCPFCHGRESGHRVVVVGDHPMMRMPAQMLARLGRRVTWLTNEHEPTAELIERLRSEGVEWRQGVVVRAVETDGVLAGLELTDGSTVHCDSVLTHAPMAARATLADQFGVDIGAEGPAAGAVQVDAFGTTSVPGVWAVGESTVDAAGMRPMSVVDSMASGQRAAAAIVRDLLQ